MIKRKTWRKAKQVVIFLTLIGSFLVFVIYQTQAFDSPYVASSTLHSRIWTPKITDTNKIVEKYEIEMQNSPESNTKYGLTCEQLQDLLKEALSTVESEIR